MRLRNAIRRLKGGNFNCSNENKNIAFIRFRWAAKRCHNADNSSCCRLPQQQRFDAPLRAYILTTGESTGKVRALCLRRKMQRNAEEAQKCKSKGNRWENLWKYSIWLSHTHALSLFSLSSSDLQSLLCYALFIALQRNLQFTSTVSWGTGASHVKRRTAHECNRMRMQSFYARI